MTTICYDTPGAYANRRVDNWPDGNVRNPKTAVYAALLTSLYGLDKSAYSYFSQVCGYECAGAGYIAGGMEVQLNNTIGTTVTDEASFIEQWFGGLFEAPRPRTLRELRLRLPGPTPPPAPLWEIPAAEHAPKKLKNNPALEPRYCVYYLHTGNGPLISFQELNPGWSITPGDLEMIFIVLEEDAMLVPAGPG